MPSVNYLAALGLILIGTAGCIYCFAKWRQTFDTNVYRTGTGQVLRVHFKKQCTGRCPIHAPSKHPMVGFPTHWREDWGYMERICAHKVGHPDPDDLKVHSMPDTYGVHGCDGCCGQYIDGGSSDY